MKRLFFILIFVFSCAILRAQFSLSGSDPGNVRWLQTETEGFRIIFPEGCDSLARVYGSWLEKAKTAVSWSSGMKIGEYYKSKMPVVLHGYNTVSNASVTWAPKRVDIFTVPDPYYPTPIKWEKLLAIHEGRHASQMQAGAGGKNKVARYFVGELFAGAVAGLYPGPTILEGDAVVAETALTNSGRGRQAYFLTYFAPAFDCGDWRDYWKWSIGSDKVFAPDHYRTGYMLISGMRVFFNDPSFTEEYFSRVRGKGLIMPLRKTVKAASGEGIKKSFRSIEERYRDIWDQDALSREPFIPARQVSQEPWRHTAYYGSATDSLGNIWSIMSGLTSGGSLVRTSPDGSLTRARSFSSYSSSLNYDKAGGKIWWSEPVRDKRWSLGGSSRIRYVRTDSPSVIHDLTKEGKYFNPSPSPDGKAVCVTEYPVAGGSRLVLLDSSDGSVLYTLEAPDSLQFTESVWVGNRLFAAGLSEEGFGIYEISLAGMTRILGPQPVGVSNLRPSFGQLSFVCDRTGVDEMYLLDIDTKVLRQVTSTRYGLSYPAFNEKGDTLYYGSLAPSDRPEAYKQGVMIYATAAEDLPMKEVSFDDIHEYPVAEALTAQEKELSNGKWSDITDYSETTLTEPRRFLKLTPAIHSWAPIYFNYDNLSSVSGDEYYKSASLGATVLFQNLVGDGYGFVGYGAHEDPDQNDRWRHSAHFKYIYSGLYPVIEFSADFGDRDAVELVRVQQKDIGKEKESVFMKGVSRDKPYFDGYIRAYLPFSFNSGGLSRGLVPQVKLRMTNDMLNDRISLREIDGNEENAVPKEIGSLGTNHVSRNSTLDVAVRGYVLRDKPPSLVYPRLGLGAEMGLRSRPGHNETYSNTAYLYVYGYLPGILQDQGIRITTTIGSAIGGGQYSYPDSPASFIPRGFVDTNIKSIVNSCAPFKYKLSFDYAVPFLHPDWSGLSPITYVKTVTITPFADYSYFKFKDFNDFHINKNNVAAENMASLGADLTVTLGNLLWLPFESMIGVRYARNFYKEIEKMNVSELGKNHFQFIFDVSL